MRTNGWMRTQNVLVVLDVVLLVRLLLLLLLKWQQFPFRPFSKYWYYCVAAWSAHAFG